MFFARHAKSVTLLVRGASLEGSMSYYLIQQIAAIDNITVRTCTEVVEARGDGHLESLTLRDTATGATETVDAQWLFVFIGAAPLTDWLDGVVARDERGFVLAGPDLLRRRHPAAGWDRWTATRTTWRPACRACSWPVTCGPSRPSGWRRRSARARWPSCSCTATWRSLT